VNGTQGKGEIREQVRDKQRENTSPVVWWVSKRSSKRHCSFTLTLHNLSTLWRPQLIKVWMFVCCLRLVDIVLVKIQGYFDFFLGKTEQNRLRQLLVIRSMSWDTLLHNRTAKNWKQFRMRSLQVSHIQWFLMDISILFSCHCVVFTAQVCPT